MFPTYLQESHGHVIFLEEVPICGSPLKNQADDSSLIVEGIIQFFLLCTLGRLGVVSAEESRKMLTDFLHIALCYLQRQSNTCSFRMMEFLPYTIKKNLTQSVCTKRTESLLVPADFDPKVQGIRFHTDICVDGNSWGV